VNRILKTYAPYGLLTLIIMLPLLLPGYILTLDAVFAPHLAAPAGVENNYVWQMLLHILNFVIPSQVIEKAIFAGIILASAIGMHQLVAWLRRTMRPDKTMQWEWAVFAAGVLYAVNPFTYDRFMAGQYGVLLGYALLPFAVRLLLAFAARPGQRQMVHVALIMVVIGIVSVPTLGEVALAGACILGGAAWQNRKRPQTLRLYVLRGLAALGLFLVLSSYWLVPLAAGKGTIAESVQQFNAAHTAAFATTGDNLATKLFSVLRLQGFWAEPHYLYVLPQDRLPGWGTVRLLVWALVVTGAVVLWQRSRRLGATFAALGMVSALFAAGLFAAQLTHLGYREPQKFTGLVALAFAVFAAFGTARLFAVAAGRSAGLHAAAVSLAFLAVLSFTPTMYWGFGGQLHSGQYPTGWFAANQYLNRQQGTFNTVFVPWHQYMSFTFAGRIIASPARQFFGQPVIVSNDPELGQIVPPPDAAATRIGSILKPGHQPPDLAVRLARHNVRYVLLAKDYDYRKYDYLARTPNLHLVEDTPSISIYENMVWKGVE
jgi:hypothetical protein